MLQSNHRDISMVQQGSNGLVYMLILGDVWGGEAGLYVELV